MAQRLAERFEMTQQRIGFEWLIGGDSWPVLRANRTQAGEPSGPHWAPRSTATVHRSSLDFQETAGSRLFSTGEQRLLIRALRMVAILFVLTTAAGAAFTQRELSIAKAHAGIEFALQREHLAWQTRDRTLFAELIDGEVDSYWEREWRAHWREDETDPVSYQMQLLSVQPLDVEHGGPSCRGPSGCARKTGFDAVKPTLVRADVQLLQKEGDWWEAYPYHETRFYRQVGQTWLRTLPPPTYWGPSQTLQTEHLRFTFSARDADIVHGSADTLDRAIASLYEVLALEPPAGDDALAIEILPDRIRGLGWTSNGLQIVSPHLEVIPADQPASDYLARAIFYRATYRALRAATPAYSGQFFYYRWSILIAGIRGWLREEMVGGASPWRDQVEALFRAENRTRASVALNDITLFGEDAQSDDKELIWRYAAAESIVDYIVDEYGEAQLRRVFGVLGDVGTWNRLIHSVFSVTWQEFEAGWNQYLIENYELAAGL